MFPAREVDALFPARLRTLKPVLCGPCAPSTRGRRWIAAFLTTLGVGGMLAPSAAANVPARGTVVEGKSLPNVALGARRAHVYKVWGRPSFCQEGTVYCTWQRSNGAVDLSFTAPGGGTATGAPTDLVSNADFIGFPGWTTTAGVTTASALAHPESVPPRYPGATIERYGDGHLYAVLDPARGIDIYWFVPTYSNTFYVQMFVFPASLN